MQIPPDLPPADPHPNPEPEIPGTEPVPPFDPEPVTPPSYPGENPDTPDPAPMPGPGGPLIA